ncbi:cell wall-active antibiotics response protein LiaF [Jeotgalibacillus marinus]|uniref:Cell wall-active antibiotics response protein LiaF n=1 Tax=Jeotgalibacillus marinus TaxID=86667 RepID=A0ABV3Q2T0_9BACL
MDTGSSKQWGCASILLIIGAVLLLLNLGLIDLGGTSFVSLIIPILLLLFGLKRLFRFIRNRKSGLFFGVFFTVYGGLLLLSYFLVVDFSYGDWWRLWPLLFIVMAISIFTPRGKVHVSYGPRKHYSHKKSAYVDDHVSYKSNVNAKVFSIGDVKYNSDNWLLENMRVHKAIGDYYFDFSKAYVPEGETVLYVSGWIGDVKMLVPEELSVRVETSVKVGEIKIFDEKASGTAGNYLSYQSIDYDDAHKKVSIKIDLGIGDARITRV